MSPMDLIVQLDFVHPIGHELFILTISLYPMHRYRTIDPSVQPRRGNVVQGVAYVNQQIVAMCAPSSSI